MDPLLREPLTYVGIITPPSATQEILKQAKELGIRSVWLQPGAFDQETMHFARRSFQVVIGGSREISADDGGWCSELSHHLQAPSRY